MTPPQSRVVALRRRLLKLKSQGLSQASVRRMCARLTSGWRSPWNPAPRHGPGVDPPIDVATKLVPVQTLNEVLGGIASTCFVVRVGRDDAAALELTLQSILRQTEPTWEILLAADDTAAPILAGWLDIDWRIRRSPDNTSHTHDLVHAAQYATADFVGVVDQGDVIEDDLVEAIARAFRLRPDVGVIYTDEDCLAADGRIAEPHFKPDWSPDHLMSTNYLGRFFAIRKARLLEPRLKQIGSDYALLLETTRSPGAVAHIDEALYHRAHDAHRPITGRFSEAESEGARLALESLIRRESPLATVRPSPISGALRVCWPVPAETPVTLVILTGCYRRNVAGRGEIVLASHFVRSILERSTFRGYRILLVDDGAAPNDLIALLDRHGHNRRSYRADGPFSFAKKANFAASLVESGVVILLNDDLEVIAPDWIDALVGQGLRPEIGAVGARLLYPDGTIQHAGVTLGYHGATGHIFHRARADGTEYGALASITRNVSAVTGAVMTFRKSVFDEVGGFDERFSVDYNDVDFCLRLIQAGYRVVYEPAANLYHFHNSSLNRTDDNPEERREFIARWRDVIERDPYFSKHFQRRSHDLPLLLESSKEHP
jgi:GT2 family glycosyltransferase